MDKDKARMLSEQEEAFTQYSVPRVLLKFILPAALSQLTFLILNLADAFFVGRTGDTFQISAMTITFSAVMLLTCIGNYISLTFYLVMHYVRRKTTAVVLFIVYVFVMGKEQQNLEGEQSSL